MRWPFSIFALLVFAIVNSISSVAIAAETKLVARSEKLGIELFGVGGANWCAANSTLRLERKGNSPLKGTEEKLFPKISGLFASSCPQMKTAEVEVFDPSAADVLIRKFSISEAKGWSEVAKVDAQKSKDQAKERVVVAVPQYSDQVSSDSHVNVQEKKVEEKKIAESVPATSEPEKKAKPNKVLVKKRDQKPLKMGFVSLAYLAMKTDPEARKDSSNFRHVASLRNCRAYLDVYRNEFDLRDWLLQQKSAIEEEVRNAGDIFELTRAYSVRRSYDFSTGMLDIGGFTPRKFRYDDECHYTENYDNSYFHGRVSVVFETLPRQFKTKLYLPGELGRKSVDELQKSGNKVTVKYLLKLLPDGVVGQAWNGSFRFKAKFLDVKIYTGPNADYLLAHHTSEDFDAAREIEQAELRLEEQKREAHKQELAAAQKAHELELARAKQARIDREAVKLYQSLSGPDVVPSKLAALHFDGNPSFGNPYDLAAIAYQKKSPFPIRTFVKVGDKTGFGYAAEWPNRVYLKGDGLQEGQWTFVSGWADSEKIDGELHALITVDKATVCEDRICMNAREISDYVKSKFPGWSVASINAPEEEGSGK